MLLAADIGNTNITLGVFDNDTLAGTFRLESNKNMDSEDYEQLLSSMLEDFKITECAIASVVDELSHIFKTACDNSFGIKSFVFNPDSEKGLKIALDNPSEVGADRIANALAAKTLYPLPAIVVDIGTAASFDIVSKDGEFLGGVIMPGLNLQFKSLGTNTSKLPEIDAGLSERAIGKSTKTAIMSGVVRGSACAIEGLIHQCELELGEKATIIATGGHSSLISQYMFRSFDYINPILTLQGIRYLYKLNHLPVKY